MARNLSLKCKLCRRIGEKLFLRGERCYSPKCALVRRKYPPGVHGSTTTRGKISEYGKQLQEKQKAKWIYGLLEKQFRGLYQKVLKGKGDTGENLLRLLELRLDNVTYQLGLAKSRPSARQIVSHGHILVNGRKINIPSYQVKLGDEISIKKRSQESLYFKDILPLMSKIERPSWLAWDTGKMKGLLKSLPKKEELVQNINARLILEYYSR